jgi:predicted ATPase
VVLVGEAGLGKSRLIAAFERQLGSASRSLLRLSCSPHYQDTPLYPLIRYFEAAAGFERTDTPAKKYSKLQRLPGNTLGLGEDETGALADLLSIPAPVEMQARQTAQRTNELTFNVLHHIGALASTAPLLAIIEDLHWADPTTSALLDALVNELEHFSTLIIISTRPAAASAGHDAIAQTAAVLVRQVAGEQALADEAVTRIVERAQGVPLCLEELIRGILGSGPPNEDGDQHRRVLPSSGDTVPTSLNGLLTARLDQLCAGKEVAQASSVIGREFSFKMLSAVPASPNERLKQALAELVHAGLIVPRGPPLSATYVFHHALIQEAAYGSMPCDRRRAVHLRYAKALEKDPAGPASTAPELLAAHFAEAGATEKSVDYYLKVAARATGSIELIKPELLAAHFVDADAVQAGNTRPDRCANKSLVIPVCPLGIRLPDIASRIE